MSWALVLALSGAAYGLKLLGSVIIGQRTMAPAIERCLLLIPAALLAGLIAKDTFTVGQTIGIDARAVGLAVAAIATWKKLPFAVIIVLGVGTVAVIRLFV
ncbi:MAG: AzlD domain-containing protein [Acidimicrobiaceae bacterium]